MPTFCLLLGRTPALSQLEWSAIFEGESQVVNDRLIYFQAELPEAKQLFDLTAGALKLLEVVGQTTAETVVADICTMFIEQSIETYSVTSLVKDLDIDGSDVKKALRKQDKATRYLEAEADGLSAAVLLHQDDVVEVLLLPQAEETQPILLAKTIAVQNIDEWTRRDREKPYADRRKGMLPPKVARMMVNIGVGEWRKTHQQPNPNLVYDPFCGTGTVLMEAAMLGLETVGSDLDKEAISGALRNLDWLKTSSNLTSNVNIFQSDATAATVAQIGRKVDVIVTEPFLGKPKPDAAQFANIFKGLEKLYLGCFRQWVHVLNSGAVVCMVMPLAIVGNKTFSLETIVDKLAQLGYTPLSAPVDYFRPQAVIHRQIWTFRYQGN